MMADVRLGDERPTRAAGPWWTAAMVFALAFPTLATWLYFVVLAGSGSMQTVYTVGKVLQFAFPLVWVVAVERTRLRVTWPTRSGILPGAAFGLIVGAATLVLFYGWLAGSPILADAPDEVRSKLGDFGVDTAWKFFALAAFYALVHSLLEEYYWRWFVFGQLTRAMPVYAAVLLSSAAFMAHHVLVVGEFLDSYGPPTWFFSACVAVGGAFWAWLYHRSRSLYAAWLSHLLIDAALMYLGYDLWRAAAG